MLGLHVLEGGRLRPSLPVTASSERACFALRVRYGSTDRTRYAADIRETRQEAKAGFMKMTLRKVRHGHRHALLLAICAVSICLGSGLGIALWQSRSRPNLPLPSDAYIWQRQWNASVVQSLDKASAAIRIWHVLAAELDQAGQWQIAHLADGPRSLASHRVIAVFRLSGRLGSLDARQIAAHIDRVLADWHRLGIAPEAIEIDHDCPTARLAEYASLLETIHTRLHGHYPLIVTALPTWIGAPGLTAVLSHVQGVVLQLHAVTNPAGGLFKPAEALRAADSFGALSPVPWQIALPSYGTRIVWGPDGRPANVESEMARGFSQSAGQELTVSPVENAGYMKRIDHAPPAGLTGWIWFRLPVDGDRRAWSLSSWLTLVRHEPLSTSMDLTLTPQSPVLYHIVLRNTGTIDAALPLVIHGDRQCAGIGAQSPYRLDYDAQGPVLVRTAEALLPVGQQIVAGWLTCQKKKDQIDVSAQNATTRR